MTSLATNQQLEQLFAEKVPFTYVADGHHRTAAAARIGLEKTAQNPGHTGNEEYNFFMAVHFPDNQLQILDYNRLVTDLNGLSDVDFLAALSEGFNVENMGPEIYKPAGLHEFSLYLGGNWYKLTAKEGTRIDDADPIGILDVDHSFEPGTESDPGYSRPANFENASTLWEESVVWVN